MEDEVLLDGERALDDVGLRHERAERALRARRRVSVDAHGAVAVADARARAGGRPASTFSRLVLPAGAARAEQRATSRRRRRRRREPRWPRERPLTPRRWAAAWAGAVAAEGAARTHSSTLCHDRMGGGARAPPGSPPPPTCSASSSASTSSSISRARSCFRLALAPLR